MKNFWILFVVIDVISARCRENNTEGKLSFTRKMNVIDFGYKSRHKEMDCCASGYDELIWYHKQHGHTWNPYPFGWQDKTSLGLKDSNLSISIKSLPSEAKGQFKCVARNFTTDRYITHRVDFAVDDTYVNKKVVPYPPPAEVCINSSTLTFSCFADFGKPIDFDSSLEWYFIRNKTDEEFIEFSPDFSDYQQMQISQKIVQRNKTSATEDVLTLHNVTRRNAGALFLCVIFSTQDAGTEYTYRTQLKVCDQDITNFNSTPPNEDRTRPDWYMTAVSSVIILACFAALFVVVYLYT